MNAPNCHSRVRSLADTSTVGRETTAFLVTHLNKPRLYHACPVEPHYRPVLHGRPPGRWFKSLHGSPRPFYRLLALPYSISQGRLIIIAVCEADLCPLDCRLTAND